MQLESRDRVGGVIQSEDMEGFLIERGPNSLRGTHEFLDLAEDLDLMSELVTGDPEAPAYVYFNGALQAVPMSPPALIRTKLLSTPAKLRLMCEPFIKARREDGEESIASFVRRSRGRHFSSVFQVLLTPRFPEQSILPALTMPRVRLLKMWRQPREKES